MAPLACWYPLAYGPRKPPATKGTPRLEKGSRASMDRLGVVGTLPGGLNGRSSRAGAPSGVGGITEVVAAEFARTLVGIIVDWAAFRRSLCRRFGRRWSW